ncbi:ParB/RepB/Spo0J family partition protein [Sphingomonas paeninsulae]|uniref:ParB/RepB/Spo0J family partition protein n=1 Tax=Sphingomonas paeninsulae TaxID=2319844 RepID=A0A494TNC1_SPHPE|nr:ParB/RepB/Spo0J family partition protein [Sphingomonas paeninsulae]AYJ86605.1 ParB/RepB/Spo0J family partition protein [Sphingomonas paeninsulae]
MSIESLPLRRKSPGLGRGLSALLGEVEREPGTTDNGVREIAIADISPHPDQPRRHFDDDALAELAESIGLRGVLQPIVVRPVGSKFQIVAGERRWRAAQKAHLHQIPAIIRDYDDSAALEVALIENIQREELNAIEEGEAYARLTRDFGHSQEALGKIVHKSRSHIANLMRLLDLPPVVRGMLADGRLQMGHARALLGVTDAELLAEQAVTKGLSVRDVERLAKRAKKPESVVKPISVPQRNEDIAMLERQLGDLLGLKISIAHTATGGNVTLNYATLDQLDMICQRLSGEKI